MYLLDSTLDVLLSTTDILDIAPKIDSVAIPTMKQMIPKSRLCFDMPMLLRCSPVDGAFEVGSMIDVLCEVLTYRRDINQRRSDTSLASVRATLLAVPITVTEAPTVDQ